VSLVEKALQKMQSARAAAADAQAPAARRPVETVPEGPKAPSVPASPVQVTPAAPAITPIVVVHPPARTDKLITVDRAALRGIGLLPAQADERRIAAEFRQIKRPLVAAARGRGVPALRDGRVILVASALPGEGKTFTSVNLTLSLAVEKNTSVVLVDGDVAKAHLSRVFGVRDEPGLTDVLLDESRDIGSVIIPTSVRGLSILPAGRTADNATELLSSVRMENVIEEILAPDPTRIIVFDSPPLLLTTEARALTGVAGQVIVVVRAEETEHAAVVEALKYVAEGRPVGLVLNQCRMHSTHGYYSYGEYGESADSN
jgi:protein-tyrosine kinase